LPELSRHEIDALAKIMDELNYYQILQIDPTATSRDLKLAYYQVSRTYHPDANGGLETTLRETCNQISKVVTEAYCVLRDPRKRSAYDAHLKSENGLRMQLAAARAAHAKTDSESRTGRTPQGKQFLLKAEEDMRRENIPGAIQNMQMAMTFEPENKQFKELLAELRKKKD
jgi:DnaJ-class molecular chaperone